MSHAIEQEKVHEVVQGRYGKIAREGVPLPEAGPCGPRPEAIARRLGYASEEIATVPDGANLGLGCGAPLRFLSLEPGETVLDLGSGAGFDAFLAAREVGERGRVIGVDMTPEMVERARRNASSAGFLHTEFRLGRIEALPIESASVDAVTSNCVINLVPDKASVYREIARVLRPGGRMVVSDVVLLATLPPLVAESAAVFTGCVGGAALRSDALAAIEDAGLVGIEIVKETGFGESFEEFVPVELREQALAAGIDLAAVVRSVRSITVRARKPAVRRAS